MMKVGGHVRTVRDVDTPRLPCLYPRLDAPFQTLHVTTSTIIYQTPTEVSGP